VWLTTWRQSERPRRPCCLLRIALRAVCAGGRRDVVEWFVAQFSVTRRDIVAHDCHDSLWQMCEVPGPRAASAGERVEAAQWLVDRFRLADDVRPRLRRAQLVHACVCGQAEIVRWLSRAFELSRADVVARGCAAFSSACRSGNLELVRWLAVEFRLSPANARARGPTSALRVACEEGHVEVARWLFDEFVGGGAPQGSSASWPTTPANAPSPLASTLR
jgi:Ankyrin repeats (3 copies)